MDTASIIYGTRLARDGLSYYEEHWDIDMAAGIIVSAKPIPSRNAKSSGQHELGFNRVDLTAAIPPGGTYTFSFQVTAPSTAGTYNFQTRMVEESIEWFGDYSPSVAVTVGSPSNRLTNPGFETGDFTGWSQTGMIIRADSGSMHSGLYAAAPAYDPNTFIYSAFTLQQNLGTPVAGSSITQISLWYRWGTSA